jgi:hypothetical protein
MQTFVVTPYFQPDPGWLQECHDSVRAQTAAATHVLICDGCDPVPVRGFQGIHIVLQRNYADYGNTPRLIGCYQAITAGAEAIAFLDADNWYQPDHLATLLGHAAQFGLDACASTRMLHRENGSPLLRCPHVNGVDTIDTNCLLFLRPAFPFLTAWVLASQAQAAVTDQLVWHHLRTNGLRTGYLDRPSVCYRTRHAVHYRLAGEPPPPNAIDRADPHGAHYQ